MKELNLIFRLVSLFIFLISFFRGDFIFSQTIRELNIVKYCAVGNSLTLNTNAIRKAIEKANEHCGVVIIPEGKCLTGTLEMKSNVKLHLEKNDVLLGSTNPFDYHSLEMKDHLKYLEHDDNSILSLLVAYRGDRISITGSGTIEDQRTGLVMIINSLYHLAIMKALNCSIRPNEKVRPKLVLFSRSKYVDIENTTLKNPACWGLSFDLCEQLVLKKLHVVNAAYSNNDGMDMFGCKYVLITDCDLNSADDGICLKSYYPGYSVDSIYIENCKVRSEASAFKFGTALHGGFKNVTIDNIKVFDTYRSAISIESVAGCDIENIKVINIIAKDAGNAIFIRLRIRVGKEPRSIRNVNIGNINFQVPCGWSDINFYIRSVDPVCHNPITCSISGIPWHSLKDVTLENIQIAYPGRAFKGQVYFPLLRMNDFPERIGNYIVFSLFGERPVWAFYVRHASDIKLKNIVMGLENELNLTK